MSGVGYRSHFFHGKQWRALPHCRMSREFHRKAATPVAVKGTCCVFPALALSIAKVPKASHPSLIALVELLARQAAREAVAASQTDAGHGDIDDTGEGMLP